MKSPPLSLGWRGKGKDGSCFSEALLVVSMAWRDPAHLPLHSREGDEVCGHSGRGQEDCGDIFVANDRQYTQAF
jgi:hypothetical protein